MKNILLENLQRKTDKHLNTQEKSSKISMPTVHEAYQFVFMSFFGPKAPFDTKTVKNMESLRQKNRKRETKKSYNFCPR